ncbi:MAG: hypothetical protein Q8O46_03640 [bacterium]|nr:hypothetical protein [bacterium]
MQSSIEVLIPPLMVTGITGTALSLTVYSVFHNLNAPGWVKPTNLILLVAILFLLSFFSTMMYIFSQSEFLIMPISLGFLLAAGIFILILLLLLFITIKRNAVFERLQSSKKFPELFPELFEE